METEIRMLIEEFLNAIPEVDGAYGYGSGVFPQANYKGNPQIDLILAVKDPESWSAQNMMLHPDWYSEGARKYFSQSSRKLNEGNGIGYLTNICFEQILFKFGVIGTEKLIYDECTLEHFSISGRLQKPVLIMRQTEALSLALERNRDIALYLTALLYEEPFPDIQKFLTKLTSLSYMGDVREVFGFENPNKISNIVKGNTKGFLDIYESRMERENIFWGSCPVMDPDTVEHFISKIPFTYSKSEQTIIRDCIRDYSQDNLNKVRQVLEQKLRRKNLVESLELAKKELQIVGVDQSIQYLAAKLEKKKQGKQLTLTHFDKPE